MGDFDANATLIGGVITALCTLAGMWLVARLNSKTAKINATTAPYLALAQRVTALEQADEHKSQQIDKLEEQLKLVTKDRDGVVAYLKSIWAWVSQGTKTPPPPIPDHLHTVLPPKDYEWTPPPSE